MNSLLYISLYSFRTKLLAANHLIIQEGTKFDIEWKSSTFVLEITMLLSPANNAYSDIEFILRGRSFIYIMNNRDTRIDPWGTPCFHVLQAEKKFLIELGDVTSTLCLLFLTLHLNQSSATSGIPENCK